MSVEDDDIVTPFEVQLRPNPAFIDGRHYIECVGSKGEKLIPPCGQKTVHPLDYLIWLTNDNFEKMNEEPLFKVYARAEPELHPDVK